MAAKRRPDIDLSSLTDEVREKLKKTVDIFLVSDLDQSKFMNVLDAELTMGMSKDPSVRQRTSLQNENTYVRSLMDGTENGDFLALDLGGTNFRVLLCRMRDGKCTSSSRNYNVPKEKLHGPSAGVFDHIAESIHKFMVEEGILDQRLPLGFTFSFPMKQEGLKKGILNTWTKSFACPDGVGEDAVRMLEDALHRRGDDLVDVEVVLNDATGTLMAGSYLDHKCGIGLILGTGCNAAYLEKLDNIEKWTESKDGPPEVVIDIEWGAFGDNGSIDFIKNHFDRVIDAHSNHKGSFGFEKLFAGHYVGDLARLIMSDLVREHALFDESALDILSTWGAFTAEHISTIERDTDELPGNTHEVLAKLRLKPSPADILVVRYICAVLSLRCAQTVSAALAVLIRRMQWPQITVAIDGSLYRHHPKLHNEMTAWLHELCPGTEVKLIDALDGSGRGAAFVAAVAVRLKDQTAMSH